VKRRGVCLVACLALGFVVPAGAHDVKYRSEVVIDYGNGLPECSPSSCFNGVVSSSKKACVPHRRVKVFRPHPGPDAFVGRDRTDADGIWVFVDDGAHGTYYAKVSRRNIGQGGHHHVCKRAKSSTITIP
jgi:hypothetical protein